MFVTQTLYNILWIVVFLYSPYKSNIIQVSAGEGWKNVIHQSSILIKHSENVPLLVTYTAVPNPGDGHRGFPPNIDACNIDIHRYVSSSELV